MNRSSRNLNAQMPAPSRALKVLPTLVKRVRMQQVVQFGSVGL
jgi:hypothetical protein